jgi:hypothetical protein
MPLLIMSVRPIVGLLADCKTTGPNQSETMLGYAKLNKQRMDRLEKTVELAENVRLAAKSLDRKLTWPIRPKAGAVTRHKIYR